MPHRRQQRSCSFGEHPRVISRARRRMSSSGAFCCTRCPRGFSVSATSAFLPTAIAKISSPCAGNCWQIPSPSCCRSQTNAASDSSPATALLSRQCRLPVCPLTSESAFQASFPASSSPPAGAAMAKALAIPASGQPARQKLASSPSRSEHSGKTIPIERQCIAF